MNKNYDLITIGAGPSGIIASIIAARKGKNVLLIEKLPKLALKLKASGGGRCNLTNTLDFNNFIEHFGKNGRFIQESIKAFNQNDLISFFNSIGLSTSSKDGFRVFPSSHNSQSVIDVLEAELKRLNVEILTSSKVTKLLIEDNQITAIKIQNKTYKAKNFLISTGGRGYEAIGGGDDGYNLLNNTKHTITQLYPAMIPLQTKEKWVRNCVANTIGKATIKINIKKYSKLKATGDLIFTKHGIRGPVVLDFAREITPLLDKYKEVPILINLTNGKNEEDIQQFLKQSFLKEPTISILEHLEKLLPKSISLELLKMAEVLPETIYKNIDGNKKQTLIKLLTNTPLTIVGTDGFDKAMVTRGGVSLKEINPKTMKSKLYDNLYFAGEVIDIDGACGGFNLQWCFSSGYLVGDNI